MRGSTRGWRLRDGDSDQGLRGPRCDAGAGCGPSRTLWAMGWRQAVTAPAASEGEARPARKTSPVLRSLFVLGVVAGVLVFTYVPYRFLAWARSLLADGRPLSLVGAAVFLAVLAVVSGCRWLVLFVLSFLEFRRQRAGAPRLTGRAPMVSVFVPAYNESETIEAAIESLLRLDYPRYEVLVVDDGSTDDTLARARRFAGVHPRCLVRVFTKPNGGKWSAHNLAFHHARGELILCLDADSRVAPDSLRRLVARIQQPGVDAVAGQVRVRNRATPVTCLQALEYVVSNGAIRLAQGHSGTVLVVPGPIGLFRRDLLEDVYRRFGQSEAPGPGAVPGPFERDTFAEDFDLSLAVLGLRKRIVYEPTAVSNTKGPTNLYGLINQRYRWCRGTIQVLRKCFRRMAKGRAATYPRLLVWVLGTYIYDLFLLPVLFLAGIGLLATALVQAGNPTPVLLGLLPFLILNTLGAAVFVRMHNDDMGLLKYCLIYDFYHAFVMNSVWLIAVLDEIRGKRMRW